MVGAFGIYGLLFALDTGFASASIEECHSIQIRHEHGGSVGLPAIVRGLSKVNLGLLFFISLFAHTCSLVGWFCSCGQAFLPNPSCTIPASRQARSQMEVRPKSQNPRSLLSLQLVDYLIGGI